MRIIDLLTEAVSSVVYHYTNLDAAARILTTGEFALSSTLGSIEEKFAPKGYPYFLSTTRTRRGGYHSNAIGDGAAMFNLDGNYYNQRYRGGPIDYWGDRHNDYGRAAEAEDRIFSKEPTMSAGGITSVHIFVKPLPVAAVPGSSVDIRARESISSFAARARTALLAAKKAGIPAYLYEDRLGWVNQDPKARIAITGSRDTLRGQIPMYNPSHPPRQYMAKWLELMYKDSTKALSTQNFGDLHSLVYNDPYWLKEMVTSLASDLSSARKPSAGADREVAVKIISYMNRHGLHTVTDFIMALRKKWTIIKNKEQEAKYDAEQADYAKFQAKEKAAQPELAESTDPILDFIHSLGNHDFFGGNCGVLAMALNEKFDMDEFLFVENDYEPERLYHVAATKNGKIYDGSGIVTRAQLLEYGVEEDSRLRPKIIAVPAGDEFYRYIDRGTDPTLEVEDLLEQQLAESTNPKSASPNQIFDYIESIHTGPGLHDTNDDELSTEEWVHQFDSFELQPVDLSTLALKAGSNKQAKIDQYAQSREEFPPIVIDGSSDWIIDGYHRANAAAQRGDTTIMAYVGVGR